MTGAYGSSRESVSGEPKTTAALRFSSQLASHTIIIMVKQEKFHLCPGEGGGAFLSILFQYPLNYSHIYNINILYTLWQHQPMITTIITQDFL